MFEAAQDHGLPVTFTLATGNSGDPIWPDAITMVEKFNSVAAPDSAITAQMFPRPIGLVIGLELTGNPFVFYPSYQEIADLPLAERVAEMRKPEVRARILADKPAEGGHPLLYLAQAWNWIFPLTDNPNYEPDPATSIAARSPPAASRRWRRPTTACSMTTVTPCCWWRWPTSRTTRSTPSAN